MKAIPESDLRELRGIVTTAVSELNLAMEYVPEQGYLYYCLKFALDGAVTGQRHINAVLDGRIKLDTDARQRSLENQLKEVLSMARAMGLDNAAAHIESRL